MRTCSRALDDFVERVADEVPAAGELRDESAQVPAEVRPSGTPT